VFERFTEAARQVVVLAQDEAHVSRLPRRTATYGERVRPELSLLAGWVLFGTALGIGVLVGWAIWA